MPLAKPKEPAASSPSPAAYEADFYAWAQEQGVLLRTGRLDALDRENLAEEIETLGRSEFRTLVSFYELVLLHMLKWDYQPSKRTRGWAGSIAVHRKHAEQTLTDNPSLKSRLEEAFERAYDLARLQAATETGIPLRTFPEACPFSREDILGRDFPVDDD
jgi:hypothetical protein